ncbi:hypothetical protein SESBI_42478 [Sesbania bispinosa]|nr:hypothetical protein SESBI_42478 [Sesbania bispinosa]
MGLEGGRERSKQHYELKTKEKPASIDLVEGYGVDLMNLQSPASTDPFTGGAKRR